MTDCLLIINKNRVKLKLHRRLQKFRCFIDFYRVHLLLSSKSLLNKKLFNNRRWPGYFSKVYKRKWLLLSPKKYCSIFVNSMSTFTYASTKQSIKVLVLNHYSTIKERFIRCLGSVPHRFVLKHDDRFANENLLSSFQRAQFYLPKYWVCQLEHRWWAGRWSDTRMNKTKLEIEAFKNDTF